jgi:hypothetical protein
VAHRRDRQLQANGDVLDFSITFPGEQSVHSSGAGDGVITINYEYVVRHEADDRAVAILRKLQQLEYQPILGSSSHRWTRKAGMSATPVTPPSACSPAWRLAADPVMIETRCAAPRRARLLTRTTDIAAVEHETGVEFMLPIVGSVVAADAYDLIRWALNRWLEQRKAARAHGQAKAPTFLEIERTRRDADGQILQSETVRLRGPVADADLRNLLERLSGG